MKAKRIQGSKGPNPKTQSVNIVVAPGVKPVAKEDVVPVLCLRDVTGADIWPGLYRLPGGRYAQGEGSTWHPPGQVELLSLAQAFRAYRILLARVYPGIDIHRDGEAELLETVAREIPAEDNERLIPMVVVGEGREEGYGIYWDQPASRLFTAEKNSAGEIVPDKEVSVVDALRIAGELLQWTTDADITGMPEFLKFASAQLVGGAR